jgi:hypothetical protein
MIAVLGVVPKKARKTTGSPSDNNKEAAAVVICDLPAPLVPKNPTVADPGFSYNDLTIGKILWGSIVLPLYANDAVSFPLSRWKFRAHLTFDECRVGNGIGVVLCGSWMLLFAFNKSMDAKSASARS